MGIHQLFLVPRLVWKSRPLNEEHSSTDLQSQSFWYIHIVSQVSQKSFDKSLSFKVVYVLESIQQIANLSSFRTSFRGDVDFVRV